MPIDKLNPAAAAGVYAQTAKVGQGAGIGTPDGGSFGQMIKKATVDAIETVRAGEKMTADAILGKAELTDVVEAMTQAELTLDATKVIRDQMISAYQEIMRMPI